MELPTIEICVGGAGAKLTLCDATDGRPPRQPARVELTATASHLRVEFDNDDSDPWSTFTHRDEPLWQQEVVEVFLAPGESPPTRYVEFELSPLGVLFDAVVTNPTLDRAELAADVTWDCPGLHWAARPRPGGWVATLEIPWREVLKALGFPPDPVPAHWRVNLYRIDRPQSGEPAEFSAWSPTFLTPADFHRPRCFGRLVLKP